VVLSGMLACYSNLTTHSFLIEQRTHTHCFINRSRLSRSETREKREGEGGWGLLEFMYFHCADADYTRD
jgi:hypothetical protein